MIKIVSALPAAMVLILELGKHGSTIQLTVLPRASVALQILLQQGISYRVFFFTDKITSM